MQEMCGNDDHLLLTIAIVIQSFKILLCYKQNNLIINCSVLSCVGLSGYNTNKDVEL